MTLLANLQQIEFSELRQLSARVGADALLVQGGNGNTSIKLDGILWIKASGKRLSLAMKEDIFVPLDFCEISSRIQNGAELAPPYASEDCSQPSIETAMHATIQHRVVVHVHSVNTIAWAIRADGQDLLKERLAGLCWQWVPYAASGVPLAHEIAKVVESAPETDVFVLANHGLVVCGSDCDTVEALLRRVEQRLAITPRVPPLPDLPALAKIARFSGWLLPGTVSVHALGTDGRSRQILEGGILYPCQAVFLGCTMPVLSRTADLSKFMRRLDRKQNGPPFLAIEGCGALVNENVSTVERATLIGLAEVTQRIPHSAPIAYLSEREVSEVLNQNTYRTREPVAVEEEA